MSTFQCTLNDKMSILKALVQKKEHPTKKTREPAEEKILFRPLVAVQFGSTKSLTNATRLLGRSFELSYLFDKFVPLTWGLKWNGSPALCPKTITRSWLWPVA